MERHRRRGVATRPSYEGSDRYLVSVAPLVSAVYDDFLALGVNGLNVFWHEKRLRIGAGLMFNGGRRDTEQNGIFENGDSRLHGLGDIDPALGLRAFASYDLGIINFGGSVTQFTHSGNDGVLANVGVSLPYRVTNRLTLRPHVGATWASARYMQEFFGVTASQAADSMFPQFTPGSGLKDVDAGVEAIYQLDRHWFISSSANLDKLTADAARSPLTFSTSDGLLLVLVGYHFSP